MLQPFYYATREDDTKLIINETQVSTIVIGEKIKDCREHKSIVKMANGDVFTLVDPSYENWILDVEARKY